MNIRQHISRRRHSERVMSMRQKRLLSQEINRKLSLQDIATRSIDKQMENIQKELTQMRNPSRSRQRKKQYKFPVTSPVWKRCKPPQGIHSNNTRRDVLLLKSFVDDDDSNDDDDSIGQRDAYRQWSTSETLLLFNNDDQNNDTAAFNRKNSLLIPSEETSNPDNILINPNLMSLDNKTNNLMDSKQTENRNGLSPDPSYQLDITEKPLVIFCPEKTSSISWQFVQGNNAVKKTKDIGNLQPVTEEIPQAGTLLPLPPVKHDGAAAAVIELPEQSLSPTHTLGFRSTADVCTSLPVTITEESKQQANSYLQNNLIVGDGLVTNRNRRRKTLCHHNNYPSETDPNNSIFNSQHKSPFNGTPDFATLARTSMSSIKKDIARRLSTTAVPTELNKLQWQKNSETVPKNRFKKLSLNPDQSSHENITGNGSSKLMIPKRENDKRRNSEGGEILGATASLRRLSLYTPREPHPRQEVSNAAVTKSSELDTGLRVNKPKEEKPRRKSYLKSLPVYDRELYNPDGSLRTVYCLPSFNECWEQAQQARYIRTREVMERDKELSVDEVFANRGNKDANTDTEESGTDKQKQ